MEDEKQTYHSLTLLRALAGVMIVLHHANADCIPSLPEVGGAFSWGLWRLRHVGWTAVDLFFVLSGFLFARSVLLDLDRNRFDLKTYYRKRISRIVPSYYVLVAVLAACKTGIIFGGESGLTPWTGIPVYLAFLHNYLAYTVCGPVWFLGVIMHAYLLLPLLFILLRKRGPLVDQMGRLTAFVVAASMIVRTLWLLLGPYHPNHFMFSHFRMDSLFIGMFVFCAIKKNSVLVQWIRQYAVVSAPVCLGIITVAMFCPRNTLYMFTAGYSLMAIAYGGLIVLLIQERANTAILKLRWTFPLAEWSYGIYLWHWYLIHIFDDAYGRFFQWLAAINMSAEASTLFQIGVFFLISVLAGIFSTRCIDPLATRLFAKGKT